MGFHKQFFMVYVHCIFLWSVLAKLIESERKPQLSLIWSLGNAICVHTENHSKTRKIQPPLKDKNAFSVGQVKQNKDCSKFECIRLKESGHQNIGTRMFGGTDAKPNEFPYQILINVIASSSEIDKDEQRCGGTIFNENFIITAAHCVTDTERTSMHIVAGEHTRSVQEGNEQVRTIKRIIIHDGYTLYKVQHDVALVELDSPLTMNFAVQPALLPESNYVPTGEAIVSGWGNYKPGKPRPDILQKLTEPIVPKDRCRELLINDTHILDDQKLCAGYTGETMTGIGVCQGDSGGPLAIPLLNGSSLLVGIASTGHCGYLGTPAVYNNVSYYRNWIITNAVSA